MSFEIDLSALRQNPGRVQAIALTGETIESLPEGLSLSSPVTFEGDLTAGDRMVAIDGRLRTSIDTVCDMCLAPLHYDLDFELHDHLMSQHDVDVLAQHGGDRETLEIENWIYDDAHLDLNYFLLDAIMSQLPLRHLCREDCKGLCPHCGANLNDGPCDCENTEIDPRWAALLAQLEENGEV